MPNDAWEQLYNLEKWYIRDWELRSDLEVTANALDRLVKVNGECHNVGTIREYIEILTVACDFVDESNPEWAGRVRRPVASAETFEVTDAEAPADEPVCSRCGALLPAITQHSIFHACDPYTLAEKARNA